MADSKISALTELNSADNDDVLPIVDTSATETKKIQKSNLFTGYLTAATAASTYAPIASPTFTGTVTLPTGLSGIAKLTSGVVSAVTAPSGTIVGTSDTQTLTNKRVNPRVDANTSVSTTYTLDADSYDMTAISAQAGDLAFAAPTGTPVNGQKWILRIKDNASPRALSWNAAFQAVGITLPTTTTASKWTYVGFVYNATDSKWDGVATTTQA